MQQYENLKINHTDLYLIKQCNYMNQIFQLCHEQRLFIENIYQQMWAPTCGTLLFYTLFDVPPFSGTLCISSDDIYKEKHTNQSKVYHEYWNNIKHVMDVSSLQPGPFITRSPPPRQVHSANKSIYNFIPHI